MLADACTDKPDHLSGEEWNKRIHREIHREIAADNLRAFRAGQPMVQLCVCRSCVRRQKRWLFCVPNQWNPGFHLVWKRECDFVNDFSGRTFPGPSFYPTVGAAVAAGARKGQRVHVDPECRRWLSQAEADKWQRKSPPMIYPNGYLHDLNSPVNYRKVKIVSRTEGMVTTNDGHNLRQTPKGQPEVPDLLPVGSIVKTNYKTGPYRVEEVHLYEPWGLVRAWSLCLSDPDDPKHKVQYWINECVAVDGRILMLYEANTDEVLLKSLPKPPKQPPLPKANLAKRPAPSVWDAL